MTDAEHAAYVRANREVDTAHRVHDPCADCTVAFSEAMRAAGLCDGRPLLGCGGRPKRHTTETQRAWWREAARRYRDKRRAAVA